MKTLSIHDLDVIVRTEDLVETLPMEKILVKLDDGSVQKMYNRSAFVHSILWRPLQHYGIPIDKSQVYSVYPVTDRMEATAYSTQYPVILEKVKGVNKLEAALVFMDTTYALYSKIFTDLPSWHVGGDLEVFMKLHFAPELKHLIHDPLPTEYGIINTERVFAERSKELIHLLSTPGLVKDNEVIDFMQTGVFKGNQVPQLLMALGNRDDVDGRTLPHTMQCSALEGLANIADLATEAASPKKTSHFNTTTIRDTQGFYRETRLLTCNLTETYSGHCGNNVMIKHKINAAHTSNYIDKIVYVDGEMMTITGSNHTDFADKTVSMVSCIYCRYEDGICEGCAGRATKHPWMYMPNVRIGAYANSKIFPPISQTVLSAKHLIRTATIVAALSEMSHKFFLLNKKDELRFNRQNMGKLDRWELQIEVSNIGHPNDLSFEGISPNGYGKFTTVRLVDTKIGISEEIRLTDTGMNVIFTESMLDHMRDNLESISVRGKYYSIPLAGFNSRKGVFEVIATNADVRALAKRVRKTLRKGISEYPNVERALARLTDDIYNIVNVNIFFIEVFIKSIVNGVVPEDGQVEFQALKVNIANNNVLAKLGHGWVKEWAYTPGTTVDIKKGSPFDNLGGIA